MESSSSSPATVCFLCFQRISSGPEQDKNNSNCLLNHLGRARTQSVVQVFCNCLCLPNVPYEELLKNVELSYCLSCIAALQDIHRTFVRLGSLQAKMANLKSGIEQNLLKAYQQQVRECAGLDQSVRLRQRVVQALQLITEEEETEVIEVSFLKEDHGHGGFAVESANQTNHHQFASLRDLLETVPGKSMPMAMADDNVHEEVVLGAVKVNLEEQVLDTVGNVPDPNLAPARLDLGSRVLIESIDIKEEGDDPDWSPANSPLPYPASSNDNNNTSTNPARKARSTFSKHRRSADPLISINKSRKSKPTCTTIDVKPKRGSGVGGKFSETRQLRVVLKRVKWSLKKQAWVLPQNTKKQFSGKILVKELKPTLQEQDEGSAPVQDTEIRGTSDQPSQAPATTTTTTSVIIRIPSKLETTKLRKIRHAAKFQFHCTECNYGFYDEVKREAHMNRIHRGDIKPYKCDTCNRDFRYKHLLTIHTRKHTGELPFICEHCGRRFSAETYLNSHYTTVHGRTTRTRSDFKCSVCSKMHTSQHILDVHMRTHTGERPYLCELCSTNFRRSVDLVNHQRQFHAAELNLPELKCRFCAKTFNSPSYLRVHEKMHIGGEDIPFSCEHCKFRCFGKARFDCHMRCHTTECTFACTVSDCGQRYKHKHQLDTHVRRHNNDRRYKCKECERGFFSQANLSNHVAAVHNPNSVELCAKNTCKICGEGFPLRKYLTRHYARHQNGVLPLPNPDNLEEVVQAEKSETTATRVRKKNFIT